MCIYAVGALCFLVMPQFSVNEMTVPAMASGREYHDQCIYVCFNGYLYGVTQPTNWCDLPGEGHFSIPSFAELSIDLCLGLKHHELKTHSTRGRLYLVVET